jgi:hypothetical protein
MVRWIVPSVAIVSMVTTPVGQAMTTLLPLTAILGVGNPALSFGYRSFAVFNASNPAKPDMPAGTLGIFNPPGIDGSDGIWAWTLLTPNKAILARIAVPSNPDSTSRSDNNLIIQDSH